MRTVHVYFADRLVSEATDLNGDEIECQQFCVNETSSMYETLGHYEHDLTPTMSPIRPPTWMVGHGPNVKKCRKDRYINVIESKQNSLYLIVLRCYHDCGAHAMSLYRRHVSIGAHHLRGKGCSKEFLLLELSNESSVHLCYVNLSCGLMAGDVRHVLIAKFDGSQCACSARFLLEVNLCRL